MAAILLGLTACQPVKPSAEAAAAAELRARGYSRVPEVTSVIQEGEVFVVFGQATQRGRVNLIYSGTNAAGQSVRSYLGDEADKTGQFRVPEVPIGVNGGLYDLTVDSERDRDAETATSQAPDSVQIDQRGRTMRAEGRLFVPRGRPDKAAMLLPGGAARSLSKEKLILAAADYDSTGGIAVAGHVAPTTTVNLVVSGIIIGRSQSDDQGRYQVTGQIAAPGELETGLEIEIETDKQSEKRTIPVSLPAPGDRITPVDGAWRVDWTLPGGGVQTTIVF
ncbi:hypothetical protein ABI_33620 [Asticcacaulis biprosthecium C19]|uniref:Uncharacterized protein n=2 Tax=Asticcacaulis biprosthecium TaxID=76891 RepID=F4QQ57_9CAUL|nr:hypothetical protein ABI_33620 [Asticcacaulis biprosthecium C19]